MINIAILGVGKVGQTLLKSFEGSPELQEKFTVTDLWNRSTAVFQDIEIPTNATVHQSIEELLPRLPEIDLVIECSHPSVLRKYAGAILKQADLFVSSPTAFADPDFLQGIRSQLQNGEQNCYIGLGASLGIWDIIRLDRDQQIKSLEVEMKKHPDSFKLPGKEEQEKQMAARGSDGDHLLASGDIGLINALAPQNTNTMAAYALAASELGFSGCKGRITANRDLETHLVHCNVETKGGLKLSFLRDNPAGHGQVTGSATFSSFLSSVIHYRSGIRHGSFIFC